MEYRRLTAFCKVQISDRGIREQWRGNEKAHPGRMRLQAFRQYELANLLRRTAQSQKLKAGN